MNWTDREKEIIAIAGILLIGFSFIFFLLGQIFTFYSAMMIVSSIPNGVIEEVNINFNETVFADKLNESFRQIIAER